MTTLVGLEMADPEDNRRDTADGETAGGQPGAETRPVDDVEMEMNPAMPDTIGQYAASHGKQSGSVKAFATAITRSRQQGGREVAEGKLEFECRLRNEELQSLHRAKTELKHVEPHVVAHGQDIPMGLGERALLFISVVMLYGLLYIENGGAAQALLASGALDLTSMLAARVVMVTPLAVGFALLLGVNALAPHVRRAAIHWACGFLVVVFLVWAYAFAIQADSYRTESLQQIDLSSDMDSSPSFELLDAAPERDWSALIMMGSISVMMTLTVYISHTGIDAYLGKFRTWQPNPEYVELVDEIESCNHEIRLSENTILNAKRSLAIFDNQEQLETSRMDAAFQAMRKSMFNGLILFVLMAAAGCGLAETASGMPANGGMWNSEAFNSDEPSTPVTRVYVISPLLSSTDKKEAIEQIETEINWLTSQAPVKSVILLVNGLDCSPIAKLEAGPGVARIRRKALVKPAQAIKAFFSKSHPRAKDDGRVNLPRITQVAQQWKLPKGSHIVVLGNPLYIDDGKEKHSSMGEGRCPTDGCLFEDRKLSIFSTIGREKALTGQYWHLGWADDGVFLDDAHRQAVLRFWHLYFQTQSASLVTAQPSLLAASEAARERKTDQLMFDEPDENSQAQMVRIVKTDGTSSAERIKSRLEKAESDEVDQVDIDIQLDEMNEETELPETNEEKEESIEVETNREEDVTQSRIDPEPGDPELDDPEVKVQKPIVPDTAKDIQHEQVTQTLQAEPKKVDEHGNITGAIHDLIRDGEMRGQKILMIEFPNYSEVQDSPLSDALTTKGFEVERLSTPLPKLSDFVSKLDAADQLWVWSSMYDGLLPESHLKAIVERWKSGRLALCLLADNTPHTKEAAQILSAIVPNCVISGSYEGETQLVAKGDTNRGFDPQSPIFHNITTFYEGTTISSPYGPPELKAVCWASNELPVVSTIERGSSRLIVHCGFTCYFVQFWDDAGVRRFAVNSAGWLSGLKQSQQL
jgi:hypothetical protein